MANEQQRRELVLAQNQHAFIQDETKGIVQVIVGPYKTGLTDSDRPVVYRDGKYIQVPLDQAISQNPTVPEGSYIVLENPSVEDKRVNPGVGSQQAPELKTGRKINIPGPATFALWPGQVAKAVEGHQLKSNEYVVVRIYNVDEAEKNWPKSVEKPTVVVPGQLLVIKGTELSFFIPPTGMEVVPDPITKTQYVRKAITLERLEYCILLDENGNKRYEIGPQVVFPTATEKFVTKKDGSATGQGDVAADPNERTVKFKAVELNDQMGLYIKVIADYQEEINHIGTEPGSFIGRPVKQTSEEPEGKSSKKEKAAPAKQMYEYKVGDELFITGKVQRIYYPRAEHAIIEYGSEDGQFKRQRYYGIAIPKGEARYVLDKNTGKVELIKGEKIFLPDPRFQVIVRRVLDAKTVGLWYPGNQEALSYNEKLSELAETSMNYVQDSNYGAAMDLQRSVNRGTRGSTMMVGGAAAAGTANFADKMSRGTKYTQPPSLTLNTKYDGPPTINIWTGYAVQVVDKTGKRSVVKGPATVLLEYDQTLEKLILSTGNPKNTDSLLNDVYLRVDHNKVSDTIEVETKDMVTARIKVSYRVNFEGSSDKWFAVENYVKFMCDHCRSLLRAEVKRHSIKDLMDQSSQIVRDTILGPHVDGKERTGKMFKENSMRIYDVEVLKTSIEDQSVSKMMQQSQQKAVQDTLELTAKQQELEVTTTLEKINQNLFQLRTETALKRIEADRVQQAAAHSAQKANISEEAEREKARLEARIDAEKQASVIHVETLGRTKAADEVFLSRLKEETVAFTTRMSAVDEKLATAIQSLADRGLLADLMSAVAPLAITEQQGIGPILQKLFSGTGFEQKIKSLTEGKQKN